MFQRTHLWAIGLMALGGLLGYAAASGQFTSFWQAHAGPPDKPTSSSPAAGDDCCSAGLAKGLVLARAEGREPRPQAGG
jgi:hypothetical protein